MTGRSDQVAGQERDALADRLPEVDVHDFLQLQGQIAVIWSIEDVQSVRADLSADQAWEVLTFCRKWHDANYGITWGTLEMAADLLYPERDGGAS